MIIMMQTAPSRKAPEVVTISCLAAHELLRLTPMLGLRALHPQPVHSDSEPESPVSCPLRYLRLPSCSAAHR